MDFEEASLVNQMKKRKTRTGKNSRYLLFAVVLASIFLLHGTGMATDASSMKLPYKTALATMYTELTGTVPLIGGTIAIAVGGAMYMLGEGQMTRTAMRICIGTGIALLAPQVIQVFAPDVSAGVLF
ncbi:TrbC/VIRB2 family protein [Sporomusa acidovorans]|nr:TrbC/VIRB2 family protein [Sporomusa acidovorans DSM 3132]SDD73476.1 TrbC/VIRB2 family protein [Sporomusa acidovorans]